MMWLILAGAIVSEVTATLALRASEGLRKKVWIAPVAIAYAAAFGLLTLALSNGMPVGIAYGIWAASGVALTAVGARVFFGERLTVRMMIGIVLIAAGVFVIELSAGGH
ncbi:SMR family transporter [Antribacter sp. KLBMP9083]|uniref:SMR family transporter n=1 Tax=Antribacter soli TaxID=2910976 RepID=A0AA41QGY9_9MICO|nr:SMR family transporter [Antribacter soli]MCF4122600.1 SMR family transporter [Antribacter soli]